MGVPVFPQRTIDEIARNLIGAAEALQAQRRYADRMVVSLEQRWAANRAARTPSDAATVSSSPDIAT